MDTTHPSIHSNELPPKHKIKIEADIKSSNSKQSNVQVDRVMKKCIITTCGDANVMAGTKYTNPELCLYEGCYLMCIDNKQLKAKVPHGNGTCCCCVGVKLKEETTSYYWKNYYEKRYGQQALKTLSESSVVILKNLT